jgi:hypothetical protein
MMGVMRPALAVLVLFAACSSGNDDAETARRATTTTSTTVVGSSTSSTDATTSTVPAITTAVVGQTTPRAPVAAAATTTAPLRPTTTTTALARGSGPPARLPEARTEVAGALWNGRIAVIGGLRADGSATNRVDLYDIAANRWTSGPPLPLPIHHTGVAASGGRLYVVGGYTIAGTAWKAISDVFSLGANETSWRREPTLSGARGALAVAVTGSNLVAIGGVGDGAVLNRVETLNTSATGGSRRWVRGPDMIQAREHLAMAAVGSRVYAIAGRQGSLGSNQRTVESWQPGETAWRPEPPLNESRGGIAASTTDDGRPCVAGGEEDAGTIASVECLSGPSPMTWRVVGRLATPRHGLAVVAVGQRLHVIGGGPRPGLFVSDAHEVLEV